MKKAAKLLGMLTACAVLAGALAPAPVLAEGGCTGLDETCDWVCFEVCTPAGCILQVVELLGKPTDQ